MGIEIEILSGDASWPVAAPLYNVVWLPEVLATLPWANTVFAHAELRILVQDETPGGGLPRRHLLAASDME